MKWGIIGKNIGKMNKKQNLDRNKFSKGKRGVVFVKSIKELCEKKENSEKKNTGQKSINLKNTDQKILIKVRNPESEAPKTILKEATFNHLLNKAGIGPRLILYDEESDLIIREFIEGDELRGWLEKNPSPEEKKKLFSKIMNQCWIMDKMGIIKEEMTNPYKNIIVKTGNKINDKTNNKTNNSREVRDDEPIMIDFERCRISNRPCNVTQFCQYLDSTKSKAEKELLADYKQKIQEELLKIKEELSRKYSEEEQRINVLAATEPFTEEICNMIYEELLKPKEEMIDQELLVLLSDDHFRKSKELFLKIKKRFIECL